MERSYYGIPNLSTIILRKIKLGFKEARKAAKLTLSEVAELAGYSIGTISDLERKDLGSGRLKMKLVEIYNSKGLPLPSVSYGDHQPNASVMHDAPEKKVIAKLRRQVEELMQTINELES